MINGSAARKLAQTATTAGARYVDACLLLYWDEQDKGYNRRGRAMQCGIGHQSLIEAGNFSSAELNWAGGVADMPHIFQRKCLEDVIEARDVLLLFHQFDIWLTKLLLPIFCNSRIN